MLIAFTLALSGSALTNPDVRLAPSFLDCDCAQNDVGWLRSLEEGSTSLAFALR